MLAGRTKAIKNALMYSLLGRIVARWPAHIVAFWLVLAVGLHFLAPAWNSVALDGDFDYLPRESASLRGMRLLRAAFPEDDARSQIIVVCARSDRPLEPQDLLCVEKLANRLKQSPLREALNLVRAKSSKGVGDPGVLSPGTPVVGGELVSADNFAALVVLRLTQDFSASANLKGVEALSRELKAFRASSDFVAGLTMEWTGSAAVGADMLSSARESIQRTDIATFVLVLAILMGVYRAPLLAAVPLSTLLFCVPTAMSAAACLAWVRYQPGWEWWDFRVFSTTRVFIMVVLYGSGTDYSLFLISRFREELKKGLSKNKAMEQTLSQVSNSIMASGMTTILGLAAMGFADFGKFRASGPAIGLCLLICLAACLTLAPALLLLLGKSAFWPSRVTAAVAAEHVPSLVERFWWRVANTTVGYPRLVLLGSIAFLAPWAYWGAHVEVTYDLLSELQETLPSKRGIALLAKHFTPGQTGPISVLAYHPRGEFGSRQAEQEEISRLTKYLFDVQLTSGELADVDEVRSLSEPLGTYPGNWNFLSEEGRLKVLAREHPLTKARFITQNPALANQVARFEVVTRFDPFSIEAIQFLEFLDAKLRQFSQEAGNGFWRDVQFEFVGVPASLRDLRAVTSRDLTRIQALVSLAVLAVILALIRRPIICLFLIASVIFGYFVTMGLTEAFFQQLYGATYVGLDWKLPLFLFVILVAIGEDYNIYLVERVLEERNLHGPRNGLLLAVVKTGPVISSCGLIMAGTFAALVFGTLRGLMEMGFALSLGIMIDAFFLRPILVPSFLAILDRRNIFEEKPTRNAVRQPHLAKTSATGLVNR